MKCHVTLSSNYDKVLLVLYDIHFTSLCQIISFEEPPKGLIDLENDLLRLERIPIN